MVYGETIAPRAMAVTVVAAQSFWPVVLLPLPVVILDRVIVPYEEASIREKFGAEYEAYFARVRRWF